MDSRVASAAASADCLAVPTRGPASAADVDAVCAAAAVVHAEAAPAPNVFVMHRGEHQVTVQMREAGGEWVRVLMERTGDLRAR